MSKDPSSVSVGGARQLANTVKTPPQMTGVTPRWLLRLLPWVNVSSGTYRVNRRKMLLATSAKVEIAVVDGKAEVAGSHLRAVPLLSDCSTEFLDGLARRFRSVRFETGENIVRQGDPGEEFFVIASGTAEVTIKNEAGQNLRVNILGASDYFGELALLSGGVRLATVRAVTPCVLAALGREDFDQLLAAAPDLRETIMESVERQRQARERANEVGEVATPLTAGLDLDRILPTSYVDYEEKPREYSLTSIQTVLGVHTRITDLYNEPIDQLSQQLRLTVESLREQQEYETINNRDFGLVHNVEAGQRVKTRAGSPTPDDMDELLSRVWKEPSFFLAHPRAIAAFGRECTRRGVPPATVPLGTSQILTWRGVPIIPCDKLLVNGRTRPVGHSGQTNILLMRVGEHNRGVVGLHRAGIKGEHLPSLTVRLMGLNHRSVAEYLITLYFSAAVLAGDALASLENVEVGNFYDYT